MEDGYEIEGEFPEINKEDSQPEMESITGQYPPLEREDKWPEDIKMVPVYGEVMANAKENGKEEVYNCMKNHLIKEIKKGDIMEQMSATRELLENYEEGDDVFPALEGNLGFLTESERHPARLRRRYKESSQ